MNAAWVDFIVCFLFGIFGVHRFRLGQIGWGLAYLFTAGLFGIGWIIDFIRYFVIALTSRRIVLVNGLTQFITAPYSPSARSARTTYRPRTQAGKTGVLLDGDEQQLYRGQASFVSARNPQEAFSEYGDKACYPGTLVVTDRRVIFTGAKGTLDRPRTDLTSATTFVDGIALQFGERTYPFQTDDGDAISAAVFGAFGI